MAEDQDERQAGPSGDPAAVAVALASRRRRQSDESLEVFLNSQAELADLQRQDLLEDRVLRRRHLALRYLGDRLRIGLQLLAIVFGLVLTVGLGVMAWQAQEDHSLVVEAFTAPPDLAARGATGQALAEDLMSRVAAIRAAANRNSLTYSEGVRADQADALKVDIPETGVSIGELQRFLHRWLGHETLLTGQVRDEADGQASVALHIDGVDPIQVKGPAGDLDGLMQQTAEKAFAAFDPGNYVIYLRAEGRYPEALAAAQALALGDQGAARQWLDSADAYALWAGTDSDRRRGLARALLAIDLNPRVMVTWLEAAGASGELGHDQAAVDYARRLILTHKSDQPPTQRGGYRLVMAIGRARIDEAAGDFAALAADDRALRPSIPDGYALAAPAAAGAHDLAAARRGLAMALAAGPGDDVVQEARWAVSSGAGDWRRALIDARGLADVAEAVKAKAPGPDWAGVAELKLQTRYRPWLALAEAMTGDLPSAQALIAATPTDCELCLRIRGRIAALAGDPAGADRWFAEAVRQAPRLPGPYLDWGQALLARGDAAGAAAKFAEAHRLGPRFADPLKGRGDALARQGQWKTALAEYDEALKQAPAWTDLRQARDAAAKRAG